MERAVKPLRFQRKRLFFFNQREDCKFTKTGNVYSYFMQRHFSFTLTLAPHSMQTYPFFFFFNVRRSKFFFPILPLLIRMAMALKKAAMHPKGCLSSLVFLCFFCCFNIYTLNECKMLSCNPFIFLFMDHFLIIKNSIV